MLFSTKLFILLKILYIFHYGFCSDEEERLVGDLFKGYNKLIRPVQNMSDGVHIAVALSLSQLLNVNEKSQIMKSNVWLRIEWSDYQLQWEPDDYDHIRVLRIPSDKVWKPDIVLFNNADGNYEVRYKSNVVIGAKGKVLWVPPAIYQSSCTIDVTYFPFDQQICTMKFGSWTFNGDQVSLSLFNNKSFVDLSDYWKSGTWDIIDVPAYLNVYKAEGEATETDITFHIIIRRKTLFYTVNLILPTVLISFLCVLVFYLPAEAGEKVTLGISILLSLVVFLLLVSKILPPTSFVLPLIAKYLLFTFLMNTVSILTTVFILNKNFRGPKTHEMSKITRIIFLKYLPILLFMQRPKKTRLQWMIGAPKVTLPPPTFGPSTSTANNFSNPMRNSKIDGMEMSNLHHPNCKVNRKAHEAHQTHQAHHSMNMPSNHRRPEVIDNRRESNHSDDDNSILTNPEVVDAMHAIEYVAEHLKNEELYIQTREDWKYLAMVMDRLLLYLFFVVTTSGSCSILFDNPHLFESVDQDKIIATFKNDYLMV